MAKSASRSPADGKPVLEYLGWPDYASIAARALSIVVVLEAAGVALFAETVPGIPAKDAELRRSALRLAAAGALLVVVQHVLAPARLAASFSGVFDASLQGFYLDSDAGTAHGIRLAAMLALIAGLATGHRWLTLFAAIAACLSFAAMGHTTTHSPAWLLAILISVHVIVVAFWFGSLRHLRRMGQRDSAVFANLLEAFSRIAAWAVPLILFAGAGLAWVFLDSFAALFMPYGWMIVGKLAAFALLLGLAAYNRWRLLPAIHAGDRRAAAAFRTSAAAEWAIIVLVVLGTVSATSVVSP